VADHQNPSQTAQDGPETTIPAPGDGSLSGGPNAAGGHVASPVTHLADLTPDPANRRQHTARNLSMVADALRQVGAARSIVIDEDNIILAGNGVVAAAADAGLTKLQVIDADGDTVIAVRRSGLTPGQKRDLALYDNRTAELAEWNLAQLAADLQNGESLTAFFFPEELQALFPTADGEGYASLSDRFGVPPFSVLDARQGYWQDRKRAWLTLGIESELGRGDGANKQSAMALALAGGFEQHPAHRAANAIPGGAPLPADRPGYQPGRVSPGGSPRPAMALGKDGKTRRGDGRGRPLAGTGD
jgi:hypothetical protein